MGLSISFYTITNHIIVKCNASDEELLARVRTAKYGTYRHKRNITIKYNIFRIVNVYTLLYIANATLHVESIL